MTDAISIRDRNKPVNKTAKQLEILERRDIAVKLRLDGYTYRQISDVMLAMEAKGKVRLPESYDERYAYRDVNTVLEDAKQNLIESGEILRIMELRNLDRLQNSIIDKAMGGDLKAIDRVISIMKQREKYVPDLTQPKQINVQTWQSEIIQLIRQNKITIEDVRNVYPQLAEKLMDELAQSGSPRGLSNGDTTIEGEFIDLGKDDESLSGEIDQ